ncbi:hypothetical protein INT44_004758 [Umbelopsis vinacea]|uniref:PAS domain-containing protein n=1 Tax=Umbelopsis vinacea TaxID=44442 RepID=A0A8H7UPB6_9FUNG|nr:hypothetical protein INT44_004758 [Umbelopsis vinacea]
MNKVDTCHDVQQKKRGRPKLRDKEAQITATSSSSPSMLSSMKSIHVSLGSKSSFSMTKPANVNNDANQATTVITMFLSMEVCCSRASDEVLDLLGYYPQEMAHRPLYGFIAVDDGERLARIHRLLLDNISDVGNKVNPSQQRAPLPPTERTSSDDFFQYSPEQMTIIANGSQTFSEILHLKKDSGDTEPYRAQFYLGGGWGADLFKPSTLAKLYIVATFSQLANKITSIHSNSHPKRISMAPAKHTPPTSPPMTSNQPSNTGQILLAPAIAPHPQSSTMQSQLQTHLPSQIQANNTSKSNPPNHPSPADESASRGPLSVSSPHHSPNLAQVDEISFDELDEASELSETTELVMSEDLVDESNISTTPISQPESITPTPVKTASPKFHTSSGSTPTFSPWPVTFPHVHSATRTSVNPYSIVSARYNRPLPMNVHVAPFTHPHDAYYMQMSSSLMNSEAAHQNRFNRRLGSLVDMKAHDAVAGSEIEARDLTPTPGSSVNGVKNSQQMSVDALLS